MTQRVSTVRGNDVIYSFAFVREQHGDAAHERVLENLPLECASALRAVARDAQRVELSHLIAYAEGAQRLLAPGEEADFHRRMGAFVGSAYARRSGFSVMLKDRTTAVRMLPTLWRSVSDLGQLSVVRQERSSIVVRLSDFPASPVVCQRLLGALEAGLNATQVEHRSCAAQGGDACEFTLTWSDGPPRARG